MTLVSCSKETKSDWTYCTDCSAEQWVGDFTGTGDYYDGGGDVQYMQLETNLAIVSTGGNNLTISVNVPDYYSVSFYATKSNNDYYILVPGSTSSIELNLAENGSERRLTGTARSYHYKADTLVIDHSVSFSVYAPML